MSAHRPDEQGGSRRGEGEGQPSMCDASRSVPNGPLRPLRACCRKNRILWIMEREILFLMVFNRHPILHVLIRLATLGLYADHIIRKKI